MDGVRISGYPRTKLLISVQGSVQGDSRMTMPANFSHLQHYPGFAESDLGIFSRFTVPNRVPHVGFLTDFIGARTRCSSLATVQRTGDGTLLDIPVPGDYHAEAIEYIGLLKSVLAAKGQYVVLELGAGWGPWLVTGGLAAKHIGITNIKLVGVEADPTHFEFMTQHLIDNGFDPRLHRLIQAAVGAEAGHARWPKVADAANEWGARPARLDETGHVDSHDANYLGALAQEYYDVEIMDVAKIIQLEPLWDLVHIDVQGWEMAICKRAAELMNQRARYTILGTHSRKLDGDIYEHFHSNGWVLEHEKPTRMEYHPNVKEMESMNVADGTQVWRNPRLS
jgi:FkbM family methyltransferase